MQNIAEYLNRSRFLKLLFTSLSLNLSISHSGLCPYLPPSLLAPTHTHTLVDAVHGSKILVCGDRAFHSEGYGLYLQYSHHTVIFTSGRFILI